MIQQVTAYQCTCDRCSKGFNTNGDETPMMWKHKDDLILWLLQNEDDDWKSINEKWYCPDCYLIDEDSDEYVVKTIEK